MEFFEQAHVAKSGESSKKESTKTETVKKQLKQMLCGYKKSDNELIKSSVDITADCDDSSSVSGFSDLVLTDSSGEDDTTRATIGSSDDIDSVLDVIDKDNVSNIASHNIDNDYAMLGQESVKSDNGQDKSDDEKESISQGSITREVTSVSTGSPFDSSIQSDEEFIDSFSLKTLSDAGSSQEFDSDGLLASKIHANLNIEHPKQVAKRKNKNIDANTASQKSKVSKKSCNTSLPLILHPRLLEKGVMPTFESSSESNDTKSSVKSPPYISISATEIPLSFNDVLGKYKHPIIRNVPFDHDDLIFSEDDSSFYSAKVMTIDEADMDEEIKDITETERHSSNGDDINEDKLIVLDSSSQDTPANDSIIGLDDTIQSEAVSEPSKESLKHYIKTISKGPLCVCVIKHPAKMYAHGKFKVRALGGTVEVCGHILTEKVYEVYAPYCNYAQCFSTLEKSNTYYGLFGKLTTLGLTVTEAEDIVTTIGEYDGVVVIEPLKSLKMDFVNEHFTVANLFSKASKHLDYCHSKSKSKEKLGYCIYFNKPPKVLEVPDSWQELDKYCFQEQSRGILCGGKGVGKSTCLRYQVNKLIPEGPVLVIDLDIGQSEFTVAGNISATVVNEPLLGPSFTHLRKPERSLNLGMINPMDNMKLYVNGVIRLIAYCAGDERLRNMRWLVNTMGLCNVVGLHFMTIITLHCRPTYLLQIESKNSKKKFDMFLRPHSIVRHFNQYKHMNLFEDTTCPDSLDYGFVLSRYRESEGRTYALGPRDERYLNFLAYFSELVNIHRGSLLSIVPYEVQLQDLCVYMNVKIPEGTVSHVLNGKIVALCQHGPGSVTKKTYVLADNPLLCHGHGLIRGIDFETETLYVITPLPGEYLRKVDALLYADWVPELRGQEAQLPAGVSVPYRMPTMYQQKQFMFTPRRRFNPVQLLKMSRGS